MPQAVAPESPDFASGILLADVPDGRSLLGHVGEDAVLLTRQGDEIFATGAVCTHYHGPLAKGLVVGDTVRCPWHHACFSLRNGEVLSPPALNPIPCWRVGRRDGRVYVREKLPLAARSSRPTPKHPSKPESVIIVGGGAAGEAAASNLRFCGYDRPITILSAEDSLPPDRPNLSKDYLAGTAPESWVPVRSEKYYREHDIRLLNNARVVKLDTARKTLHTADGQEFSYGALLLATGAEPIRLNIPGSDSPRLHYVRSVADSRAIIKAVEQGARRALIIGASFIGLEVAASLRTRKLEVHVVAPEARPMERVFGSALGDFVRTLHESKGVVFHLGRTVSAIDADRVKLDNGEALHTDLIVAGIGVRPVTALAEQAGIKIERGVRVDEYLRTSAADVYAAGDIARWPDRLSATSIRVEHWAVAQHQGQVAARNMLGYAERYTAVPFFWSQHYDVSLNYVGHAEHWDQTEVDGDPAKFDCAVSLKQDGRVQALVTVWRDRQSLEMEAHMQQQLAADAGHGNVG
jgi:3-phenylpropionate/trans-cinnamate dioxygenase ferredoxin reductase subunit